MNRQHFQHAASENSPRISPIRSKTGKAKSRSGRRWGAGWLHSDGRGISLQLAAMPLDGRITLRVNQPKDKK